MPTVFLLDDHEVVRTGLKAMLETQPDLQVVGEAGTAAEAMAAVPALRPDVAVIDVRLPDGDGITVCRELRSLLPDMACLMLTSYGDEQALSASVLAGAAGYVLKQVRGTELIEGIRTVAAGGSLLDPVTTATLIARMRAMSQTDPRDVLSLQERRILGHIGEGMTNRQIGEQLGLAEKTVKNNVSSLLGKLGLARRTQAAVLETELRTGGGPSSGR